MLEEAVATLKSGGSIDGAEDTRWSPQITVGTAVMIPESYVADLQLRLSLYKRLADLEDQPAIEAFAAELIDRFGPLPEEVVHLLEIVTIKNMCRRANVAKVDVGPKGAVIGFRDNVFPNPAGLLRWLAERGTDARVRPDQSVVFIRNWDRVADRLKGTAGILGVLARLAGEGQKAAA
jgi:transcription-repair coupling factor (superfamily II helicase)